MAFHKQVSLCLLLSPSDVRTRMVPTPSVAMQHTRGFVSTNTGINFTRSNPKALSVHRSQTAAADYYSADDRKLLHTSSSTESERCLVPCIQTVWLLLCLGAINQLHYTFLFSVLRENIDLPQTFDTVIHLFFLHKCEQYKMFCKSLVKRQTESFLSLVI